MVFRKQLNLVSLVSLILALTACSDDDSSDSQPNSTEASYEVTVKNVTNAQPLTPLALVIHKPGFEAWQSGSAVSTGLEELAESGNPMPFLDDSSANSTVVNTASSENGPFGPGAQEMLSVTVEHSMDLELTIAAMLANTNDAFTGIKNWSIGNLAVGDSMTAMAKVYDAGTEANTETAATMPGPAAGGEGFNSVRDDLNFVAVHRGVITIDDGLTGSALNESHRWLGPAAEISVVRTK